MNYIVKSGDTLSDIATSHGTTWQHLQEINKLDNPNNIKVGQVIKLTDSVMYTVKSGDTLARIALSYRTTWQALQKINNLANPNSIYPGQVLKISGSTTTSNPTTPVADTPIEKLIAWEMSKINHFAYSENDGRLTPNASGHTDCSGLHYWAYNNFLGINIGTWTGEQISHGKLISTDASFAKNVNNLKLGDLLFFRWGRNSPWTYDHVELYKGNGQLISHGGPGYGPNVFSVASQVDEAINAGGSIAVRRYI